ncbi:hypothetical protein LCGC14_1287930 [marine sediment metagenome]|uniref:Radical SAM core domain-containing protein n=1 Tax=marine sediment metagenome TaxID=412755 RepID=A0A0F9LE95_9ZZZZ
MGKNDVNTVEAKIYNKGKNLFLRSESYNFNFNRETGFFMRWGKTPQDDPDFSPFGCEILDIEISSGGDCQGNCRWCYKSNGGDQPTHNMTLDEFKIIIDKMPPTLTQCALGIMDIHTNPDFFEMMEYSRSKGIIPNYTTHGLDVTDEAADKTAKLCGAIAVSLVNKKKTFEAIRKFLIRGITQVNCHYMLCQESYDKAFEIIDEIANDETLFNSDKTRANFNAIVFLQYKSKGRNPDDFHSVLDVKKYQKLMAFCEERSIRYGFDSCSAPLFLESIKGREDEKFLEALAEPCEALCMSYYINSKGIGYPCSFVEDIEEGVDVLGCDNFIKNAWYNKISEKWRKKLLKNNRKCPVYNLDAYN